MKQLLNRYLTVFVAMFLLIGTGGNVMAGGLVDTSVERFKAADFTNSANITNPWWTLPAGHNFLYFAQDGEDCIWNPVEVLGTTSNFFGDYANTNARIILDREWVDKGCIHGTDPAAFSDVSNDPDNPADEVTYDWLAQDSEQNIWYMGEDTFSGGSSAGSFVAGCNGAKPASCCWGTLPRAISTSRNSLPAWQKTGESTESQSRRRPNVPGDQGVVPP